MWAAPDLLRPDAVRVVALDKAGVQIRLGEVDPDRVPAPAVRQLALGTQGKLHWPLYLHGDPGAGKTFAGLYALRRATGLFLDALTWARLRIDDGERAASLIDKMGPLPNSVRGHLYYELVVIDEIGLRGRATDWQLECLLVLLNARYKLPLIVTGNLTPDQVKDQYDGRIADRLCAAGTVVNLAGTSQRDWRPAQPKK